LDKDKHNFERVSYTYPDVLTENVHVSFVEDNHHESIAH
ncbi:Veg family protein, partial [Staphylococcus aureus]|nr:Veg family protein [Staphylococcus aureus]